MATIESLLTDVLHDRDGYGDPSISQSDVVSPVVLQTYVSTGIFYQESPDVVLNGPFPGPLPSTQKYCLWRPGRIYRFRVTATPFVGYAYSIPSDVLSAFPLLEVGMDAYWSAVVEIPLPVGSQTSPTTFSFLLSCIGSPPDSDKGSLMPYGRFDWWYVPLSDYAFSTSTFWSLYAASPPTSSPQTVSTEVWVYDS